ncbi:hypothetical protein ACL6C3_14550 [Capilliphycus salinus ALCB114379]|uniref:hypothetical protein n=1 Tax=Capilliphycus salinus TaxID=2768948 RepID=UPI0039A41062
MNIGKVQIGFLRTLFPGGQVEIRALPSWDGVSIGAAKSGDQVLISETERAADSGQIWYYVLHEKSGLKGWIPANKVFVLKTMNPENSANLHGENQETSIHRPDRLESIQTFKKSQSLIFGLNFMPKYHRHK